MAGRPKNTVPPATVKLSTNAIVESYLVDLVRLGSYGASVPEVAEEIVRKEIRRLIDEKILQSKAQYFGDDE